MKKLKGMTEVDCYRARYGSLVYCVQHYKTKLGWVHLSCSVTLNVDQKERRCYINGELVPPSTFEFWVKFEDDKKCTS